MSTIREKVKSTLDRRYVTKEDLVDIGLHLERFVTNEDLAEKIGPLVVEGSRASAFLDGEDPHELRKRLFEAHRLANEAARAIEALLAQEVLMWQAMDSIAVERTGRPYPVVSD